MDCKTLEEFDARAEKHLGVKNAEEALEKADSPTKNFEDKKRKHEELKSNDQKRQRPEDHTPPAPLTRYTYYTKLKTNRAEVFQARRRASPLQKTLPYPEGKSQEGPEQVLLLPPRHRA